MEVACCDRCGTGTDGNKVAARCFTHSVGRRRSCLQASFVRGGGIWLSHGRTAFLGLVTASVSSLISSRWLHSLHSEHYMQSVATCLFEVHFLVCPESSYLSLYTLRFFCNFFCAPSQN